MLRLNCKIAIVLLLLGLSGFAAAQTAVKIHEILRHPSDYGGHDVAVFGTVKGLSIQDHYDTFLICGGHCLNVIAWGHPRIVEGQALSVRGRFELVKRVDHRRLEHVIEVQKGSL